MTGKQKFVEASFDKLKTAINNISDNEKGDIYALSFWYYKDKDDPRYPRITFSYNTNKNYQNKISDASNDAESKWNYAFWLQNEIEEIGGEDDTLLKAWFTETPYYYSDEQNKMAENDDGLFDKLLELGNEFDNEFIEEIISLTQKLFRDKVIENKFDKEIPILVHELEYYDKPISWTVRSNPKGLVDEFINWTNSF